jgi:hypothetical protein
VRAARLQRFLAKKIAQSIDSRLFTSFVSCFIAKERAMAEGIKVLPCSPPLSPFLLVLFLSCRQIAISPPWPPSYHTGREAGHRLKHGGKSRVPQWCSHFNQLEGGSS